jgi:16S rRNA (cytidine1402-2'-O)-methyltransferase
MNHFEITARTVSYHEHNEKTRAAELVERLERGEGIALVSDAGMPGISDPGYRLVQMCVERRISVVPVPGATAVMASLVASGLPTHAFQFLGFAPAKRGQRRKFLEALKPYPSTSVFYEAPHRILETLADALEVLGDRPAVVAREITKLHEEFLRGSCSELLAELRSRSRVQGETTVLIGGAGDAAAPAEFSQPLKERVDELMRDRQLTRMEALKVVARERKLSKSAAYRAYQE